MHRHIDQLGPLPFDEADRRIVAEFQQTFCSDDIAASFGRFGLPVRKYVSLCDVVFAPESGDDTLVVSTDVGTVLLSSADGTAARRHLHHRYAGALLAVGCAG